MRFLMPVALLAILFAGCRDTRPRAQEWITSAPDKTIIGISCHMGWLLERPDFLREIARYPIFSQALELFLDRAKIDLESETGRISFYALDFPNIASGKTSVASVTSDLRGMAIMQIAGFKDSKTIQKVTAETFAPEGSIKIGGREYPLFVVLDINNIKLRILIDNNERIWIGDLTVLQEIAKQRFAGDNSQVSRASEWISPASAIQGFVQPHLIPKNILSEFTTAIPNGIKGIAWSAALGEKDSQPIDFDLAATGTEDSITQLKPWMQRLTAAASTLAGEGMLQPTSIQEKNRLVIRCQLKSDQMGAALNLLKLDEIIALPPADKPAVKPK